MKNLQERYEESQDAVREMKARLAQKLMESVESGSYLPAEEVAKDVNRIAYTEGEATAYGRAAQIMGREDLDMTRKLRALLQLAAAPTDDQWSGRSNDVRRAYHDGLDSTLSDIAFEL